MPSKATCYINLKFFFITLIISLGCNKEDPAPGHIPSSYEEMFAAMNLQFDVTYNYVERINNVETGKKGRIKFSLSDTSMTETFNSRQTKDRFRLDSMQAHSAKFENAGLSRYHTSECVFINSARERISFVNGSTMVSFGLTTNGTYYYYQYILSR